MGIGKEMLNGGVSGIVLINASPRLLCLTYYLVGLLYSQCHYSNRNGHFDPTKGQRCPIPFTTSSRWGCFSSGSQDYTQPVEERAKKETPDTMPDELNPLQRAVYRSDIRPSKVCH